LKYDFSCECGKGFRVLRGDLAEVTCGGCGKAVPVPAAVRSARPAEFRSFAVEATPVAPEKTSGGEKIFFGICWAAGLAMFAVPFFMKSETTELYRKAMADPTPANIREFTELESYGNRRDELIKAGWEKALSVNDVDRMKTFYGNWGSEYVLDDKERRLWEFADRVGTEKAYELYLDHFSYETHSADARSALERLRGSAPGSYPGGESPGPGETPEPTPDAPPEETYAPPEEEEYDPPVDAAPTPEQERQDLVNLQTSPSREAAIAFLDRYPSSGAREAACEILLRQLEDGWTYPADTPSPPILRQIMDAKESNQVTVSLSGFTSDDVKQQVFGDLKSRLEGIGLRVSEAASDGEIRVSGSESNDTRTYNKWGLPDSGPFGETISVTIEVYLPGSYDPSFSTSSYASSPSSVSYMVYGEVDMGPSQGDVHRSTLTELSTAMESVFRYR